MNEEELRKKFEEYIKNNGIKVRFVSNILNVSESLLSHWRKKRRNLSKINLIKLQKYMKESVKK